VLGAREARACASRQLVVPVSDDWPAEVGRSSANVDAPTDPRHSHRLVAGAYFELYGAFDGKRKLTLS